MNTLIIGASAKPHRFAYKALKALQSHDKPVVLFAKKGGEIEELSVYSDLSKVQEDIDTVTLYVNPLILETLIESIIALKPRRVIFNPGTESEAIINQLQSLHIEAVIDCTLIMLREDRY